MSISAITDEIREIIASIETDLAPGQSDEFVSPLAALEEASTDVGKSFSGSWLGYHANVYYADLERPPPGAHFSQEWGLEQTFSLGTTGDWREYNPDQIEQHINQIAHDPDLTGIQKESDRVAKNFQKYVSELASILTVFVSDREDSYVAKLIDEVSEVAIHSAGQIENFLKPSGQLMSRDAVAVGQGFWVPPHVSVYAKVLALRSPFAACETLLEIANKADSHISRNKTRYQKEKLIGSNIFIGHGQSTAWRDLKDFVQDRLKLPWDEFNRVPVAGVTNIARLSEMLDSAAIAFLVLTGEDEQQDGKLHARMNVVHEAGLFQGRLGFSRAIILLEEGCEEFSNIEGLGQIRFPKDDIASSFEELRRVLEREDIIRTE